MTPMPQANRSKAILINTLSNYGRQIVQIAAFLVLTPFIAERLGADGFGLWSLIQAAVGIFGLFDLGFGTSVVKYVADARGRGDSERLSNLTSTFFWVYTALGTLMLGVAAAFAVVLPAALSVPEQHVDSARIVFVLIALRTSLGMPLGMYSGVMTGFQRQWWANVFKAAATILYAAGAYWALRHEPSIERLAVATLLAHTAAMVLGALVCTSRLPGVSISPGRFRWRLVREVSSFSLYFFVIQISTLIYTRVDAIVVQSFLSLSAVALYSVAARVSEEASGLCRQLTNALTPVIAELNGAGEERNIRAVFRMGTKLSTALAAPLLLGLMYYAEPLLGAWMGPEYKGAASACQVLLAAMMISVIHGNAANILSMTGRQRFLAFSFFGGQVLNLILTIILIQSMQLVGVALATLVSSALVDIGFVQRRAGRAAGMSQARFYLSTVGPSCLPLCVMFAALRALEIVILPSSLFAIGVLELLGCIAFLVAFSLVGLDKTERTYFFGRIRAILRR